MKRLSFLGLLLCCFLSVKAQTEIEKENINQHTDTTEVLLPAPIPASGLCNPFLMYGIVPFNHGFNSWELHKGFNASVGLSVTFSPGNNIFSGAGFGQDAAFLYATPLTPRLSVAGGVYAGNFDWGRLNLRNVGVTGIAAFQVTERISLYAYGNKSLMPQRPAIYYPVSSFATDRIGGMVNFKIGDDASISFGVERLFPTKSHSVYYKTNSTTRR